MRISKYSNYLIFLFILINYSFITTYFALFNNPIINPKNLFFIILIFTIILVFLNHQRLFFIKSPLFYWIFFYLFLVLLYFILNTHLDGIELRRIIFPLLLFLCLLIILSYDENLKWTKKAILIATCIAIFNNIYEFFNPFTFYTENSEFKIIGRSAGFYINSNISGEAIVLGLLLSFSIVAKKYKYLFLFFCFLGVLVTFSRTSLLGYFIIIFFFIKNHEINKSFALSVIIGFIFLVILFFPFLEDLLETLFGHDAQNLIDRLKFFTGNNVIDHSQQERKEIAYAAFNLFADNLPFGAGLGVTEKWQYSVSAHNMYLTFMAEFGIIGIFLYPLLILSASYEAFKIKNKIVYPFIIYMLLIGFTTHNVLDTYHILTALAVIANMNKGENYAKR